MIGRDISAVKRLPTEAGNWWEVHNNSASTVEELQRDARKAWPGLKKLAQEAAARFPGVYINAGPNDMFAVKGVERMREKAAGYMETGLTEKEAVGQLTDPVRVTIVIGKMATVSYAEVASYLHEVLERNPMIGFHVFMNKFENSDPKNNPTAYGAVHIAATLNNDDGSRVYAEVQIHKEVPVLKKNGAMHYLYDMTRAKGTAADTKGRGLLAQRLLSTMAHYETLDPIARNYVLSTIKH
jgi:hypothetical protein